MIKPGVEESINSISLVQNDITFSPTEVHIADIMAQNLDCRIDILDVVGDDESKKNDISKYHSEIIKILDSDAKSMVLESENELSALLRFIDDDSMIISGLDITTLRGRIQGGLGSRIIERSNCNCGLVYSEEGLDN